MTNSIEYGIIRHNKKEVVMEEGFLVLRDGEIVSKEGDFGNAAELRMVLQEIHPESVIEIREFVGHLMSSS